MARAEAAVQAVVRVAIVAVAPGVLAVDRAARAAAQAARVARLAVRVAQRVARVVRLAVRPAAVRAAASRGSVSMKVSEDGVGISLRHEHYRAVLETQRRIDWLEVQPENFMGRGGVSAHTLVSCAERHPVLFHGVALNLGGIEPLDGDYLRHVRGLLDRHDSPWFSEHLSYSRAGGKNLHGLLPLPRSVEAATHLAERISQVENELGRSLVVENISAYGTMPGSELTEGEFVSEVVERSGAGLLLDINNLYVNAHNLGFSAEQELAKFPLHRVRQIHLAGHRTHGELLLDDHGSSVADEVWALYRAVLRIVGPVPTLIEWENHVPELDVLLDEADLARRIMRETQRSAAA